MYLIPLHKAQRTNMNFWEISNWDAPKKTYANEAMFRFLILLKCDCHSKYLTRHMLTALMPDILRLRQSEQAHYYVYYY